MLETIAAEPLFRWIAPVVAGLLYSLVTRYIAKGDEPFRGDDWFLAIAMMGSAVTALPGLIALRAQESDPGGAVTLGAFALLIILAIAVFLARLDTRVLSQQRDTGGLVRGTVVATIVPNLLAASCLAAVFAYAP